MNPPICSWRICVVISVILYGAQASAVAPTFLVNPGVYAGTASSTFNDPPLTFPVTNLFDGINSTESVWAIQGFLGGNSQGRDEGWISVDLNRTYLITDILFAPRKPSGNTDGIDRAYFWISDTPFGVNVTSNSSTSAFLSTATGLSPNLSIGPFATAADVDYPLVAALSGKYVLGRFVNLTDHDNNRNLGARTFAIIPEPSSMALIIVGWAALVSFRCGVRFNAGRSNLRLAP